MAITINGSGTIGGVSVGGLPDGIVDNDTIANGTIANAKLVNDSVTVNGTSIDLGASNTITAGKVLQVVNTISTTQGAYGNGTTISQLNTSITPSSTSSKILVMCSLGMSGADTNADIGVTVKRGSTEIQTGTSGSITSTFATQTNVDGSHGGGVSFSLLDSPSTTSSITYTFVAEPNGVRSLFINRRGQDTAIGTTSNVILMEIAG